MSQKISELAIVALDLIFRAPKHNKPMFIGIAQSEIRGGYMSV